MPWPTPEHALPHGLGRDHEVWRRMSRTRSRPGQPPPPAVPRHAGSPRLHLAGELAEGSPPPRSAAERPSATGRLRVMHGDHGRPARRGRHGPLPAPPALAGHARAPSPSRDAARGVSMTYTGDVQVGGPADVRELPDADDLQAGGRPVRQQRLPAALHRDRRRRADRRRGRGRPAARADRPTSRSARSSRPTSTATTGRRWSRWPR